MDVAVKAVLAFIVLLAATILLRVRTNNKVDVKTPDIVIALTPVALWLFLTGQIQELTLGDLKIVAAIRDASQSQVAAQVTLVEDLPVQAVSTSPKAGLSQIPEIMKKRSQALGFVLGGGGYYGPAIQEYLRVLTEGPFLQYIVINTSDGKFFGVADARQLAALMRQPDSPLDVDAFAAALNAGNKADLERLPGFIPQAKAVKKTSNRRKALEIMEKLDVQTLPVVDDEERFVGIVERSKLTASILIDIAAKVESKK